MLRNVVLTKILNNNKSVFLFVTLSLFFSVFQSVSAIELDAETKLIEQKLKERDFPEALNLLNKYLNTHPKSTLAYLRRGQVYQLMGRKPQALIDFSTAIKFDPRCTPAYLLRSSLYRELNQTERAKQDLMKLHELDPVRFKRLEPPVLLETIKSLLNFSVS